METREVSLWSKILLFKCYVWMYRHVRGDGRCEREEHNFRSRTARDATGHVTSSNGAVCLGTNT